MKIKITMRNFPGGTGDKTLPANAGDTGLIPGPEKIPHAVNQMSPQASTTRVSTRRDCAPQGEKPPQ